MKKSTLFGAISGLVAIVALLAAMRSRVEVKEDTSVPQSATGTTAGKTTGTAGQTLEVGFLPVTCHLTCPVTAFATKSTTTSTRFISKRFTNFPDVVDNIKSKRLQASFMIAPLAMKLREQGIPIKIVYLGHRDGSTVMVAKDSPAKSLRDLRGKTFAIPNRASNQYFVINKLMADQGVKPSEIRFVEMAPPDMPSALATHAIDAYFVGEPHAAKAQLDGSGRVLYMAKDIWPHFISCVLVVTEDLINEKPDVVRDLVRGIAQSGEWAETHRFDAAKVAAPAFRQNEKLVRFVLTQPPDRVSYRMLAPSDQEMQKIADMGFKLGVLPKPLDVKEIVDRSFIPKDIKPADISEASVKALDSTTN
jgi:NitT/TauT family transport system substrate-binding protein